MCNENILELIFSDSFSTVEINYNIHYFILQWVDISSIIIIIKLYYCWKLLLLTIKVRGCHSGCRVITLHAQRPAMPLSSWPSAQHGLDMMEVRGPIVGIGFPLSHVCSGDQTQVIKLDNNYLYPLSHLSIPSPFFSFEIL